MNVHANLRPKLVGDKYLIPVAPYNLTLGERRHVATLLSKLTVPDGYSSNIARCVNLEDGKIPGMKSHDCYVFLQEFLTPSLLGVLDDKVLVPLRELSVFFKQLCSKTLKKDGLEKMEKNIAITLCKLECIFVPSFFDVMMHLPMHLASQAMLAGPMHYRWMFRFEREMRTLKFYVRNKARPEGSIAEGYIENECLTFCSRYLTMSETKFNHMERNEYLESPQPFKLSIFSKSGKPLGKANQKRLSMDEWKLAHLYALQNCDEVQPFFDEFANGMDQQGCDFCKWFEIQATQLFERGDERLTQELLCLAHGPMKIVVTYEGYVTNGFRFHTRKRQKRRRTQNSGVVVKGDIDSGAKAFYGVLEEVIVLEYDALQNGRSPRVVMFKCKWFDVYNVGRGITFDDFGATYVNVTRRLQTNEPFALASQIEQVFYVPIHNKPNWRYVVKTNPRNYFDFPNDEHNENNEALLESSHVDDSVVDVQEGNDDEIPLVREDVIPNFVDVDVIQELEQSGNEEQVDGGSEEEEEGEAEFSDGESSIGSLNKDLEDIELDDDMSDDDSSS